MQEAYNNINFTGKGVKPPEYKGFSEVYWEGVEAGKNFNINRLEDTTSEQVSLIN